MTPIKRFYSAIFTIIFFNIFLIPGSFASLHELKEKDKEDEKHLKKPAALTLKNFKKKFEQPLFVSFSTKKRGLPVCQNLKRYEIWEKKHGKNRNFAIYPIVCSKSCDFFVKKGGIIKLRLEKEDQFLAVLPLGKFTFATAPSRTVLPLPKGFTSKDGKKVLTIGDLRGDIEEEAEDSD